MFNNLNTRKSALFLALLVLLSAGTAGVVMAAAPTVDTETTETSQQSGITDGGAQTYNATTSSNFSWSADSNYSKIVIDQDNETLYSATPEEYHHNSTSGTSYYNVSLEDDGDDYSGLDVDAGANVTLNVTLINNTEASSPDKTNLTFTFANGNFEAFQDVDDEDVTTPSEDGYFTSLVSSDDETDPAKIEDSTVGIAGNDTETVTMSVVGTALGEALDASAESTESGDIMWSSTTGLEDGYILVANSEAPDKDWFDDESTYATYDSDAQTLTFHNVNERVDEDAQDVELSATGNDGLGLLNTVSMLSSYDASNPYLTAAVNADWSEPSWEDEE